MKATRARGSHAAWCMSSYVAGPSGNVPSKPAMAVLPGLAQRWPLTTQTSCPSTRSMWGTASPQRRETRDVHVSAGSVTWVSTSMTSNRSNSVIIPPMSCVGGSVLVNHMYY